MQDQLGICENDKDNEEHRQLFYRIHKKNFS